MKKLLALVLALVMTLGLATVGSNAAFTDADSINNKEAVDVMSAIGVFQGADGKFSPKANLTREQAAKLIAYLDLGESTAEALPAVKVFDDVAADRWSAKYIAYCEDAGYIAGVGNGNFDPAGELTGYAFGKMVLCALGYDAAAEEMVGNNWTIKVAKLMESNKIADGIDGTASATLTREEAAQYCFNALQATMVYYDGGNSINLNGVTIGQKGTRKNADTAGGGSTGPYSAANVAVWGNTVGTNTSLQLGEKLYGNKLTVATTVDDLGRSTTEWSYKGAKVASESDKADYTIVVTKGGKDLDYWLDTVSNTIELDLASATNNATAGASGSAKNLTDATVFYRNGYCDTTTDGSGVVKLNGAAVSAFNPVKGAIIEVYVKNDGKTISKVCVLTYTADVVAQNPDTNISAADKTNDVAYYTSFKTAAATKDTQVPGFDAATYVKDTPVALAINPSTNAIADSYVLTPVTGKITSVGSSNGTRTYTVDGTAYVLSGSATDTAINGTVDFKNGNYSLYLDKNNYVLYTKVNTASVALTDVYYVPAVFYNADTTYGAVTGYTYYAQTVALDGTVGKKQISWAQYNGVISAWTQAEGTYLDNKGVAGTVEDGVDTFTQAAVDAKLSVITGTPETDDATTVAGLDTLVTKNNTITTASNYYFYDASKAITVDRFYSFESVSGEDYMNAKLYNPSTGSNQVLVTGTFGADLTSKMTTLIGTSNSFKVNADTKYVLVKGSLNTISTKSYTGGVNMDDANITGGWGIYTKDSSNNKVASYIVLKTGDNTQNAANFDNMLYVAGHGFDAVEDGYIFTNVYDMTGTKVANVLSESSTALNALDNHFVTYSVDADGYYTFYDENSAAAKDFDDNMSLVNNGVVVGISFAGLYDGTKISAGDLDGDGDDFIDVNAANAVVVDLRSVDNKEASAYTGDITNLNAMQNAYQRGAVVFDAYATKDNGIEVIFVRGDVMGYTIATQNSGTVKFYANAACAAEAEITDAFVAAGTTVYAKALTAGKNVNSVNGIILTEVAAATGSAGQIVSFTMPYADIGASEFNET